MCFQQSHTLVIVAASQCTAYPPMYPSSETRYNANHHWENTSQWSPGQRHSHILDCSTPSQDTQLTHAHTSTFKGSSESLIKAKLEDTEKLQRKAPNWDLKPEPSCSKGRFKTGCQLIGLTSHKQLRDIYHKIVLFCPDLLKELTEND